MSYTYRKAKSEAKRGTHIFSFPTSLLKAGSAAVVSVLVENMGHNEDFSSNDSHKAPRGLVSVTLPRSSATLRWKIQGALGGDLTDAVRGPFNNGGLYSERNGWYLIAIAVWGLDAQGGGLGQVSLSSYGSSAQ